MQQNSLSELKVLYLPIESLKPHPSNARTHSRQQIRQIASSIQLFGFTNPILIANDRTVIAGHGRIEGAKQLGLTEVPTILLENLTEQQVRAYVIADNRIAEKAGWNKEILAIELQHLILNDDCLDVTVTGFEVAEIDLIIEETHSKAQDKDDVFQIDESSQAVTQLGDIWQLGEHRLLCDNSLLDSSFASLMARRKANLVFADPPYNVKIQGHASGNGKICHREFAMAAGELDEVEFIAFLKTSFALLAKYSTPQSVHFLCSDWRHLWELSVAGREAYGALLNVCVWAKNAAGMGSFYRSQHEFIFVFRNGKGRHRNNIQLGRFGRNRSNIWNYDSINSLSRRGDEGNLLSLHPTGKPVAMVADAILDSSARGDIVLDSFLGSGTTLIAAERVGRICMGIELDPLYVDVAIRRWQKHTGDRAIHLATGKSFDEIGFQSEVRHGE
jgi:DNA modification methylase